MYLAFDLQRGLARIEKYLAIAASDAGGGVYLACTV